MKKIYTTNFSRIQHLYQIVKKIIGRDNFTLLMLKKLNADVFMSEYINIQAK